MNVTVTTTPQEFRFREGVRYEGVSLDTNLTLEEWDEGGQQWVAMAGSPIPASSAFLFYNAGDLDRLRVTGSSTGIFQFNKEVLAVDESCHLY